MITWGAGGYQGGKKNTVDRGIRGRVLNIMGGVIYQGERGGGEEHGTGEN